MPNLVYFDLETQKSAAEVGGWHNKRAMKMSLGVTYSTERVQAYRDLPRERGGCSCCKELQRADRVIGYNVIDFDFEVLGAYSVFDLSQVPVLDLMRDVEKVVGSRIGLDAISRADDRCGQNGRWLGGAQVVEGRPASAKIAEYCCYDVKATRLVHEFGSVYGCVFYYSNKTQRREKVAVNW